MKAINTIEKKTVKGFRKNPDLDKYANKVLFKKKVEEAKRLLNTSDLPKA